MNMTNYSILDSCDCRLHSSGLHCCEAILCPSTCTVNNIIDFKPRLSASGPGNHDGSKWSHQMSQIKKFFVRGGGPPLIKAKKQTATRKGGMAERSKRRIPKHEGSARMGSNPA